VCLRFCFLVFNYWTGRQHERLGRQKKIELVDIIAKSGLVGDSVDEIEENSSKWANARARYDKLAYELRGRGCLMLLPEDITPYA